MSTCVMPVGKIDWEAHLKRQYVEDKISLEQFELEIESLLAGNEPIHLLIGGLSPVTR